VRIAGARTLITGATGGVGTALAEEFQARGARLVLSGRNPRALDGLGERLEDADLLVADLSSTEEARRLAEKAGEVDIIVASAGLEVSEPLEELEPEQIADGLAVNFGSLAILASDLGRRMLSRGRGHLAIISSIAAQVTGPGPIYVATKWAQRGLAITLANDWRGSGVGVSIVYPGAVRDVGMIARGLRFLERQPPSWQVRTVSAQEVARATADAIERERFETIVADPMAKAAVRLGGGAPRLMARLLTSLPAARAMRRAMIAGSKRD
jgi:short-subunit dehydrogenase